MGVVTINMVNQVFRVKRYQNIPRADYVFEKLGGDRVCQQQQVLAGHFNLQQRQATFICAEASRPLNLHMLILMH